MVKGAGWDDCHEIDSENHDDFLLEAATRSLEKRKDDPDLQLTAIIEVWEKRNEKNINKHFAYNSYLVLVNASMHKQADYLRRVYLKRNKVDLHTTSLQQKGNSQNGSE
jgi:hypothetical protein